MNNQLMISQIGRKFRRRLDRGIRGILAAGQEIARQAKRCGIWTQWLILIVIILTIHASLIFHANGYISWGNYLMPYSKSQLYTINSLSVVWSPYQYMGNPVALPFIAFVDFLTTSVPLFVLSHLLGAAGTVKAYAILATMALGLASLLFLRSSVRNYWGQLAGGVLLIAGPFQLQLYGQGDYIEFVSEAFVLLSIFLLGRAIRESKKRYILFPLSMVTLLLAVGSIQLFALGSALYVSFLIFFSLTSTTGLTRTKVSAACKSLLRLLPFPLLLLPLLLPLLASPVDLGPSSVYALPLSTFSSYTTNPLEVFFLQGYNVSSSSYISLGYKMVTFSAGSSVASLWLGFVIGLVLLISVGLLISGDRRGYFVLIVASLASLLGSGPHGPLGTLNTYLYVHLFGYQAINASYYWDWIIVVPMFAIGIGTLLESVLEGRIEQTAMGAEFPKRTKCTRFHGARSGFRIPSSRPKPLLSSGVAGMVLGVLVVSAGIPLAVGSQNGPMGIQSAQYPADYSEIPRFLSNLIGSTYAGVAIFNPDANWFIDNATQSVPNAFFLFPTVRTPGLPVYAAFPYPSNFYNYWVYKEFYTNATRYVGELFAVEGVEYFLVLYGTQSATSYPYFLQFSYHKNASQIMNYQTGVVPVVSTKDFVIYRDLYYSNVAEPLSNLSMVTGGYSELNAMAYAGVNLTNQGIVFPSDVPSGGCTGYMNRVDRIYAGSANALDGLAVTCTAISSSDPASAIAADTQGWQSSYRNLGGSIWDAWPTSLAVVHGGPYSIDVPIDGQGCPLSCNLWLPVRFSGDGGLLAFEWQGTRWEVNTSRGWQGTNNSMVWIQLPFSSVPGTNTLQITSMSGWNAVGTVYVASSNDMASFLQNATESKQVFMLTSGEDLQLPPRTGPGQSVGYCSLPTADALGGEAVCLQANGTLPLGLNLDLPDRSPGELSMLVRAIGTTTLTLDRGPTQIFGFDTGRYNGTDLSMSWFRLPINTTAMTPNATLPLQIANGTIYISEVTFTPPGSYGPTLPVSPQPNIVLGSEYYTRSVTSLNVSVSGGSPVERVIKGAIGFTNATPYYDALGDVVFDVTPALNSGLAVRYDVSPGLLLQINGIKLGGNGTQGYSEYSSVLSNVPSNITWSSLVISFASYNSLPSSSVTCHFSIWLNFADIPLLSNVTDVQPGSRWSVTAESSGYKAEGEPAPLLLIRIPYFSSLATSSASTLAPALGSIDSLTWDPGNITTISVTPITTNYLNIGGIAFGLSFSVWMMIEYAWIRRERGIRIVPP